MFSIHFEQNLTVFIKHAAKELKDNNNDQSKIIDSLQLIFEDPFYFKLAKISS